MRVRNPVGLVGLLVVGLALAPQARGQEVPPSDPALPLPIYHDRPEMGGFYMTGAFPMYRQTNPLKGQIIAVRGFYDADGSVTGDPGRLVGTGQPALRANDAGGPGTYEPGFKISAGWRFRDGSVLDISWMNLLKNEYFGAATLVPPRFNTGRGLQNTFVSSPVFNFPTDYGGAFPDVAVGDQSAGYGIWNAADVQTVTFRQFYTQVDATYRVPIHETECWRCYGLVGPRFSWIWERFYWRVTDLDLNGVESPLNDALYTNTVSNRMYGVHAGGGSEYYLGHGFALALEVEGTLFLDIVKERARYERGLKFVAPQIKRAITEFTIVPGFTANVGFWYYPIEGIQLRIMYNVMGFFNTVGSPNPVSFNYGGLDPAWERVTRFLDGFEAGIGITF